MLLPQFQCLQPEEAKEACALLAAHGDRARILAGGTALITDLRRRLVEPAWVVSLKNVRGLDYIRAEGDIKIGALTTLASIESSPLVAARSPALAQAAALAAVPPIRRVATIGGNLALDTRCIYLNQSDFWRRARPACFKRGGGVCHAAPQGRRCLSVYQGDLAPVLMAMDARLRLMAADRERVVPLGDFFTGRGEKPNILAPGELIAEVIVPQSQGTVSVYEKLRVRQGMDFPLAGVAVSLQIDGGVIAAARLVLGAVGPAPVEVPAAFLAGRRISEDLWEEVAQTMYEHAHPASVLAMEAWYRRKMVRVLAGRALRRALSSAGGE